MMLYGYHFSTIENNWEDLTPLNEFYKHLQMMMVMSPKEIKNHLKKLLLNPIQLWP